MLTELRNNIDFYLRNLTKFSRKNFVETDPDRIEQIRLENLNLESILDHCLVKNDKISIRVLDVGCKNWSYVGGEYSYFNKIYHEVVLDGVELDAYRLYSNFYSRYETAKYYTKDLKNTNYIVDDVINLNDKYDFIIWILPFITVYPLQYWGLPKKYFCPEKLLNHIYSNLLNENGQLLVINQGIEEAELQKNLLDKLNIDYKFLGEIENNFFYYKNKRFGYLISK